MKAIVYTTGTGSTKRYAELLSLETGLPVYSLKEAKKNLSLNTEIIYLGWIMAGSVKGYATAAKRFKICAVCAVGMGKTGTQTDDVQAKTSVPMEVPLFTLQGNFNIEKLHGVYRLMMKIMVKALENKKEHTQDENEMLQIIKGNEDFVDIKNLNDVLKWYKTAGG